MTTTTEVRERPILFSAPMVRAILEGRKTQTRRVVKPQPTWNGARWVWPLPKRVHHLMGPDTTSVCSGSREWHEYAPRGSSPYGQPGDLLYVREAFGTVRMHELGQHVFGDGPIPDRTQVVYRAGRLVHSSKDAPDDFDLSRWPTRWSENEPEPDDGWKPSIHMPKKYARIWLRVTGVRVERVQGITNADAMAEGGEPIFSRNPTGHYRDGFAALWDRLNADRGHPWESNPWVWVVSFEREEAP